MHKDELHDTPRLISSISTLVRKISRVVVLPCAAIITMEGIHYPSRDTAGFCECYAHDKAWSLLFSRQKLRPRLQHDTQSILWLTRRQCTAVILRKEHERNNETKREGTQKEPDKLNFLCSSLEYRCKYITALISRRNWSVSSRFRQTQERQPSSMDTLFLLVKGMYPNHVQLLHNVWVQRSTALEIRLTCPSTRS